MGAATSLITGGGDFESYLLNTYAAEFLENVDPDQISRSLLRGNITLTDVRLKNRLLEDFLGVVLPLKFCHIHVDKLEISISLLIARKVSVTLTGVTATLCMRPTYEWSHEEQKLYDKLTEFVKFLRTEEGYYLFGFPKSAGGPASWMLPAVEITIKDTSLRLEDWCTDPQEPWFIGGIVDTIHLGDPLCATRNLGMKGRVCCVAKISLYHFLSEDHYGFLQCSVLGDPKMICLFPPQTTVSCNPFWATRR